MEPIAHRTRVSESVYRRKDGTYAVYRTTKQVPCVCRRQLTRDDVEEFALRVAGGQDAKAAAKEMGVSQQRAHTNAVKLLGELLKAAGAERGGEAAR